MVSLCEFALAFLDKDLFLRQIFSAAAGIACLLSCAILAWVPFFISEAKDVFHLCGNCKVYLAQWHRRDRIEILAYPEVNKDENKDEARIEDQSRESRLP